MGKASFVPNLLTIMDRKEHARHRRLIGIGFSQSAMKSVNERLLHHVKSFYHVAYNAGLPDEANGWSHPLTMSDLCSYLTFNVMADFIYGKSYDLIHCPDYRHLLEHIEESNLRTGVLLYCPQLYIGRLDRKLFPRASTGNKTIHSFINQIIQERKSENGVGQSIYEQLGTQRKSTDHPLTPEEIRSEAMLLTIAGNDTTSTALCAALFYLGKNLHAYEKLAAEIRTKFSVLDGIGQDETLRNCHYLHACTYESLRMSPPVGSSMWREVGPGGTSIDGEFIPCGYGVGTGIYSIHHNPKYFPRPHDFIPERWLSEKDGFICKEQADIPFAAYILFSAGTRACLGRHLAITELLTTIAALVLLYDFRISHTENGELGCGHALGRHGRTNPGEFQLYHRVTSGKEGPILQLRPRKGN
ncbi:cytochrome P450 [Aspergillus flavus]|nr:cytochrome P450 [Aspergillus flavus]